MAKNGHGLPQNRVFFYINNNECYTESDNFHMFE